MVDFFLRSIRSVPHLEVSRTISLRRKFPRSDSIGNALQPESLHSPAHRLAED